MRHHRLATVLTALLVGGTLLAPSAGAAVPTTDLQPQKLARGADIAIPHIEDGDFVDGARRVELPGTVARVIGQAGDAWLVGTGNVDRKRNRRVVRVEADGTVTTILSNVDTSTMILSADGSTLAWQRFVNGGRKAVTYAASSADGDGPRREGADRPAPAARRQRRPGAARRLEADPAVALRHRPDADGGQEGGQRRRHRARPAVVLHARPLPRRLHQAGPAQRSLDEAVALLRPPGLGHLPRRHPAGHDRPAVRRGRSRRGHDQGDRWLRRRALQHRLVLQRGVGVRPTPCCSGSTARRSRPPCGARLTACENATDPVPTMFPRQVASAPLTYVLGLRSRTP